MKKAKLTREPTLSAFTESEWSSNHASLEGDGQWAKLIQIFQTIHSPSIRWQVAAFRAYVFLGQTSEISRLYTALNPKFHSISAEDRVIYLLAIARMAREKGIWGLAKSSAEEAIALVSNFENSNSTLEHDAEFALALCLDEQGRFYLALDKYQSIRRSTSASSYRRGLAALNEAWSLWDLGRPEAIRPIVHLVPIQFRPRMELMIAMVELNQSVILKFLAQWPISAPESEKRWVAILLIEWLYLYPEQKSTFHKSEWLPKYLKQSEESFFQELAKSLELGTPLTEDVCRGLWREQLDSSFVRMLSWIAHDSKTSLQIYQEVINPLLLEKGLETSLIPSLESMPLRTSPWSRKLSAALKQGSSTEVSVGPVDKKISVTGHKIELTNGPQVVEISAVRSPRTIDVLRILAGTRNRRVSKQTLHENLTGNRYTPYLHDDRIYKLLGRLANRIEEQGGFIPWEWSGDNEVATLCLIEVVGD